MFGRWIIDTGHYFNSPDGSSPAPGFRAEIYPPLLMATAGIRQSAIGGGQVTRAVFTSRPFLVGQTFGSPDTLYQDGVDDDGPLNPHLHNEPAKFLLDRSLSLEAHPKIKSQPFRGAHLFHFVVRPPAQSPGRHGVIRPSTLSISFNFTIRTGCAVEVTSDGTSVNVFISMNSVGYQPPDRPARTDISITKETLITWSSGIADAYEAADIVSTLEQLLGNIPALWGSDDAVHTDSYAEDSLNPVLTTAGAAVGMSPGNIPPGQGVTTDNNQSFPVTGWLEVVWGDQRSSGFGDNTL